MSKVQDVVAWVMEDDKILKLEKASKTYDLSDEVVNYLKKADLFSKLEDQNVEVEIDETKGQSGMITRLKVTDGKVETKKEEEKVEEGEHIDTPPEARGLVVKELTVGGVSVDKSGVIFKEEENVWYTLDSTINAQKFKDECTKKKIEVSITRQEKGNDVIKGYVVKEEEKKEEPKDKQTTSKKSYNNDMQKSIEAQASVNSANRVAQAMVTKDSSPEEVLKIITKVAEHNFKTIQNLKSKE